MVTMKNEEDYIQYLYSEIDSLRQKLNKSELQCENYCDKLRDSKKECDLKEKFIQFRESQLIEAEETIFKLKERIIFLSKKISMSAPGSPSGSRPPMRPIGRDRLDSRSRAEITSLDNAPTSRLFDTINDNVEILFRYAIGTEHPQNMHSVEHIKDLITNASRLIKTELDLYDEEHNELQRQNDDLQIENGELQIEIDDHNDDINKLMDENNDLGGEIKELRDALRGYKNRIYALDQGIQDLDDEYDDAEEDLLEDLRQLENNYNRLKNEAEDLRQDIDACDLERRRNLARFNAERVVTDSLNRRLFALKITNTRLQIELMNAPINAPLPPQPPQQPDQIWLLLH